MPLAATAEFSFERDIAPYASRFFDEIGSSEMSTSAKQKLQGSLLGGISDIESQRLKLQEERDQGRERNLSYERGVLALEEARASRSRIEQQNREVGDVQSLVRGIVDSEDTPDVKTQKLARTQLELGDRVLANPALGHLFKFGHDAIPKPDKPLISNAEMVTNTLKGVPWEEMVHAKNTGDFSRVQAIIRGLEDEEFTRREALTEKRASAAEERQTRTKLLDHDLSLARGTEEDSKAESPWMKAGDTEIAYALHKQFGTPQEMKRFDELKGADSDRERLATARMIQAREKLKILSKAVSGPTKAEIANEKIYGKR